MTSTVQLVVLIVLGAIVGLAALARRYPNIGWLRPFHMAQPHLSDEERARIKRRGNVHTGIELILMGLAVPAVYVGSSIMMFSDPGRIGLIISAAIGFGLVMLGLFVIQNNRLRTPPTPKREREHEFYERVTGKPWDSHSQSE
jgi:hypothetical protein